MASIGYTNGCFKFFPVGQGLFYGGYISNGNGLSFSFVYDCGTEKKWNHFLETSINAFPGFPFVSGSHKAINKLDLVVVSHLHGDHFSGIHRLISKVGKPKKLILPFIDGDDLMKETVLYGLFYQDEDINKKQEVISFFLKEYSQAKPISDEDLLLNFSEDESQLHKTDSYVIGNGLANMRLDFSAKDEWRFAFIPGTIGRKGISILSTIKSEIAGLLRTEGFASISSFISVKGNAGIDALRDIYKRNGFSSNAVLNNTSTLMLHYPVLQEVNYRYRSSFFCSSLGFWLRSGAELVATLLMGDSAINKQQASVLRDLLNNIEPCYLVTQLPHHGAKNNFLALTKHLWTYIVHGVCVASFGMGNSYGHPSKEAVHSLAMNQLIKVNEYRSFYYELSNP